MSDRAYLCACIYPSLVHRRAFAPIGAHGHILFRNDARLRRASFSRIDIRNRIYAEALGPPTQREPFLGNTTQNAHRCAENCFWKRAAGHKARTVRRKCDAKRVPLRRKCAWQRVAGNARRCARRGANARTHMCTHKGKHGSFRDKNIVSG